MVVCFFCGALPVVFFLVCFFVFSCNIESGAPGRHKRVCCDVVRARSTVRLFSLAVRFLLCLSWFVRFFVFFACKIEAGAPGRHERVFVAT